MSETLDIGKNQLILSYDKLQLLDGVLDQVLLHPSGFRFGISPIEMDPFILGSTYRIEIKDDLDRRIILKWDSYFNLKQKKILGVYEMVLASLWKHYFQERLSRYEKTIDNGEVVTLGNFQLSKYWIKKTEDSPDDEFTIELDSALIIRNWNKLQIQSKFDSKAEIKIDTLSEWDSPFIYALLDKIKGAPIN